MAPLSSSGIRLTAIKLIYNNRVSTIYDGRVSRKEARMRDKRIER